MATARTTVVPDETPASSSAPNGVQVGESAYENAFYRVALAPGGIRSLFDKQLGKEVLRTEKLLGAEVVMLESVGNGAGEFGSVQQPSAVADFERASSYQRPWAITESGAVYTTYSFTQQLSYALLVQNLIFYHHLKRIDVEISLYNWNGTKSREYRMMLPVNLSSRAQIAYEVPMGVAEVGRSEVLGAVTDGPVYEGYSADNPNVYVKGPAYLDVCADVHPREVQNFISAAGDDFAVTLSSSVAVCDYIDPTLAHADYPILQPILLASRKSCHSKGNWYLQPGDHHFRFSIFSHAADWRQGWKPAVAANHDLRAVVGADPLPDAASAADTELRQRVAGQPDDHRDQEGRRRRQRSRAFGRSRGQRYGRAAAPRFSGALGGADQPDRGGGAAARAGGWRAAGASGASRHRDVQAVPRLSVSRRSDRL